MGRLIVYRGSRSVRRNRRGSVVRESWYVGPMAFKFVTIAAVAVLLSLYITTHAQATQDQAIVNQLTEEQSLLTTKLQALEVESARNSNATKTNEEAVKMGLTQSAPEVQLKTIQAP